MRATTLVLVLAVAVVCGAVVARAGGCDCEHDNPKDYDCGCCEHIKIKDLHIDDNACVNLTVIPERMEIEFTITLGDMTLVNETVSLEDPHICIPVPYLGKAVEVCVDFDDMKYSKEEVSGCVSLAFKVFHIQVFKVKLGCFKIPLPLDGSPSVPITLLSPASRVD